MSEIRDKILAADTKDRELGQKLRSLGDEVASLYDQGVKKLPREHPPILVNLVREMIKSAIGSGYDFARIKPDGRFDLNLAFNFYGLKTEEIIDLQEDTRPLYETVQSVDALRGIVSELVDSCLEDEHDEPVDPQKLSRRETLTLTMRRISNTD